MSEPIKLAPGYHWSPKLKKPAPLVINEVRGWINLEAGNYDVTTLPVGDNWAVPDVNQCAFTSVKMTGRGCVSIRPRFPVDEPSSGFLYVIRGPYADNTPVSNRGNWQISSYPSGMVNGRISMPVFSHNGARAARYYWNGIPWCGNGFFPQLTSGWWGSNPIGPKRLWSNIREAIVPCQTAPDVTIINNLPQGKLYMAISKVDMFGRETEMCTPLEVNVAENQGMCVLSRRYAIEMGTCGFYVYVGTSIDNMHRQPVLSYEGAQPKYLWPAHLQQFPLQKFIETGIRHVAPPSYGVASIIPQPYKDIVDGKTIVEFEQDSYDVYCPLILEYDVNQITKNGRVFGSGDRHCVFNHKTMYGNAKLVEDIPMVIISNQRDNVENCTFKSAKAYTGFTFSDPHGGGAFKNSIEDCYVVVNSEEGIGLLVDDLSSIWSGNHTTSELRVKRTQFNVTVPVLIEGNQSAKISFVDMCTFWSSGITRYPADTVMSIYSITPNDIDAIDVEGLGGAARAITCVCSTSGSGRVTIDNFFCDQGAYIYAVFAYYNGGTINLTGGERINAHSQRWARIAEAPASLGASFKCNGIRVAERAVTALSFQLNQLSLDLDYDIAEFISPTPEFWISKGRAFEYPAPGDTGSSAYYDFRAKKTSRFTANFADVSDSIPPKTATTITIIGEAEENVSKYKNNYSRITDWE